MEENISNQNATPLKLRKIRSQLIHIERQINRMKTTERKQDTRKKIQLGGLIKKAGLGDESTSILFGMLLDCKEKINFPDGELIKQEWKIKGDIALTWPGTEDHQEVS